MSTGLEICLVHDINMFTPNCFTYPHPISQAKPNENVVAEAVKSRMCKRVYLQITTWIIIFRSILEIDACESIQ